jgi:hypothetical protein
MGSDYRGSPVYASILAWALRSKSLLYMNGDVTLISICDAEILNITSTYIQYETSCQHCNNIIM